MEKRYTVAVLVRNQFGVLNRVTSMFRRRQFNICSLAVSETESDAYSRITIQSEGDEIKKEQLINQLYKLPDICSIRELEGASSISFELLLIKLRNDPAARGTFAGLRMDTGRADMTQAVLEGVAFAIRDSFDVARALGIPIHRSKICGGGAKSPLWKTIMANVLNIQLDVPESEQGPGMGGAMLAMVAAGRFPTVQAAADALVHVAGTVEPEAKLTALYEERYRQFQKIYPACKALFPQLL